MCVSRDVAATPATKPDLEEALTLRLSTDPAHSGRSTPDQDSGAGFYSPESYGLGVGGLPIEPWEMRERVRKIEARRSCRYGSAQRLTLDGAVWHVLWVCNPDV